MPARSTGGRTVAISAGLNFSEDTTVNVVSANPAVAYPTGAWRDADRDLPSGRAH